jgi:diguanylate cyclase
VAKVMLPARTVCFVGLGLLVVLAAWLFSRTPLHRWLDTWLRDQQQTLVAEEHYFPGSLVVDIDDASLKKLEPVIGTWPYSRDVYARVYDYLLKQGAQQVVFDLLFAEARSGDNLLQQIQQGRRPAVYVAAAGAQSLSLSEQDQARIDRLSWPVVNNPPAAELPSIILPRAGLTTEIRERIGLVTATSDVDGILRRLSLLYQINGDYLPSLPLRTLIDEPAPEVTFQAQRLQVHGYRFPVDQQGKIALYFPRNPNAVLTMPFFELVEAAYGLRQDVNPGGLMQGKTVFIGSTAYLSDRVNTPRGPMSGTYLLALAHETLSSGLFLLPDVLVWNLLLLLLALLPGLIYAVRSDSGLLVTLGLPAVCVVLMLMLNLGLLYGSHRGSDLLFPLELLLLTAVATNIHYQLQVKRHNRSLQWQNKQLDSAANTDALTGLPNRRAFLEGFAQELERVRRFGGELPTLAIMDLDHFKSVNDRYGHDVGDLVLQLFAQVLRESVRTVDLPARWGGEEFVVLLPRTGTNAAVTVLDRVRTDICHRRLNPPAEELMVTVSVGLAAVSDSDRQAEDCIKIADRALYKAKQTGRNRICVGENGMS